MSQRKQEIIEELKRRGVDTSSIGISDNKNQRKNQIMEELSRRGIEPSNQEWTIPERAAQVAHGAATASENLADLANQANLGTQFSVDLLPGFNENEKGEKIPKGSVSGIISKPIEKLAGRKLTPEKGDTTGKILHTAGEFLSPVPGAGYIGASSKGIKGVGKLLAKESPVALTASTALHAAPSVTEEGTIGRGIEDLAKVMLGGITGRKLTGKAGEMAKDIQKLATSGQFKESIKKAPSKMAGKVMGSFARPNEEVLNLAEKHGVELPANVGLGSTPMNWVANNYNKSIFASRVYKDVIRKADESMIGKVNQAIDSLGTTHAKPHDASKDFLRYLKEDESFAREAASEMYDKARNALKPTDTVVPSNTIKSLMGAQDILGRDIQSGATKKVAKVLSELAESWGLGNKKEKLFLGGEQIDPKQLQSIFSSEKNLKKPIEVSRLDDVRKELNQIIDFDPEARGAEAFLSRLVRDLEKDIELSSNKEYVNARKAANKFFYDNIGSTFKTELAESIMTGQAPVDAFNKMNKVENIKLFEKIVGDSEQGRRILNQLKQAKLREILESATTVGGLERGSLGTAQFSKLFSKKEGKQELIEALLPNKKTYNDLEDIARIAEEFSNSGRELLNTSGTSLVGADIDRIHKLAKESLKAIVSQGGVGIAAGAGAGALPGAAIGVLGPWLTTRLMSNPKFVSEARQYAISRSKGYEKPAEAILNRMIKLAAPEAKNVLIEASKRAKPEENQE